MNYTVTIVEAIDEWFIVCAHRAAVEHLLQEARVWSIVGDGTLCMPHAPLTLKELADRYGIRGDARLAEALEIDEAMRSKSEQEASHG